MNLKISIIIPTKDRHAILEETLNALIMALKNYDSEIIVVNDADTNLIIKEKSPIIKVLNNKNNGAASARNYGFENSTGDIIVFLDDDMLVSEEVLKKLLEFTINSTKKIFLPNWEYPETLIKKLCTNKFGRFLNKIEYTSLKGWIKNSQNWDNKELIKHDGMASYCLIMKRNDFIELGGYNEQFPFAGYEDYDVSKRLDSKNFKFYIVPNLTIFHIELDRIELIDWLNRKRRNALTRRMAVEIGYVDKKLKYGFLKLLYLKVMNGLKPFLFFLCNKLPNSNLFDSFYMGLMKNLISLYIYLGYIIDYDKYKS